MAQTNKNRNLLAMGGMIEHNLLIGRTSSAELRNNDYYHSDGMPRESPYYGMSGTNFVDGDPADVLPSTIRAGKGSSRRKPDVIP